MLLQCWSGYFAGTLFQIYVELSKFLWAGLVQAPFPIFWPSNLYLHVPLLEWKKLQFLKKIICFFLSFHSSALWVAVFLSFCFFFASLSRTPSEWDVNLHVDCILFRSISMYDMPSKHLHFFTSFFGCFVSFYTFNIRSILNI